MKEAFPGGANILVFSNFSQKPLPFIHIYIFFQWGVAGKMWDHRCRGGNLPPEKPPLDKGAFFSMPQRPAYFQ